MTAAPAYDNSVRIGCARVSTRAQEHQAQLDALAAAHCREIITETASTRGDRPKLREALGQLQAGARHRGDRRRGLPHRPGAPRPGTDQLRDLTSQGYGPRKIARITGCSERAIRQLLTSAGLRQPAPPPDGDIDPHWLREQYQDRQRSLKDIATETRVPVESLAAAARKAGLRVRHGIAGRAHPLAALGGPGAFTTDVWNVFTRPGAEQRIRTQPASSAPGTPSSPARSASSRPPSAPSCCSPGQTGDSR
ncbi:MAG TPA: recombinase family protein [Streptosporangiaceae bacterium]|nr:recombinase family protein [Streptosporangiaceae bacterium]